MWFYFINTIQVKGLKRRQMIEQLPQDSFEIFETSDAFLVVSNGSSILTFSQLSAFSGTSSFDKRIVSIWDILFPQLRLVQSFILWWLVELMLFIVNSNISDEWLLTESSIPNICVNKIKENTSRKYISTQKIKAMIT